MHPYPSSKAPTFNQKGVFMKWFRIWHGLPSDARLGVVARKSGLSRPECIALYVALLDAASKSKPPGALDGVDAEELSVQLDIDTPRIQAGLRFLRERQMISADNRITCWKGRPSSATLRARAHRREQLREKPPHPDDPAAVAARRARLVHALSPGKPSA